MTTRLEESRKAYAAELIRDQKKKELDAKIASDNAKIKQLSIAILNNVSTMVKNHKGYRGIETYQEYSTALAALHEHRKALESATDTIGYGGYFEVDEQRENLNKATELRIALDTLEIKLNKQADRESIERFI